MNQPRQETETSDSSLHDLLQQVEAMSEHFDIITRAVSESQRLATLGTLTALIAHEFNNILTPVISYAQLALNKPDDNNLSRKALEKGLSGAERAARISTALLSFAHGKQSEQDSTYLPEAIQQTLACLGRDLSKDGITLNMEVAEVHVSIEPIQLQQVLLNLIINARKALMIKGSHLSITATAQKGTCWIEVADDGPGIPPAILDSLFDPFVSAPVSSANSAKHLNSDSPAQPESQGTGLGLSLCRELINQAGGSIRVESQPDRGATFIIQLPIAEESASTHPRAAA